MKPIGSFELEENAEKYAEAERQRRLRVLEYKKADLTDGEYRGLRRSVEHGLVVREVTVNLQDRLY